ncbi:MAG: hypothetical protein HGGPFJEG_00592 [Ignavibacteria bacterium]|nr:hypothetical protein [Ignavibacteria bacterium]
MTDYLDQYKGVSEESDQDKEKIKSSFFYSFVFVGFLWLIAFFEWASGIEMSTLGVLPRKISGLAGIFMAPLIHADFSHLISNSVTLFLLLFSVLYFYRGAALKVFFIIYLLDGILVWIFARQSYHIGASGLVYGFASFLFFSGVFRKDKRSVAISLLIVFLYGGMVWGVLPVKPEISFESHLFGAAAGFICAFVFRKVDLPPDETEDEEALDSDEYDDGKSPEDAEIDEDAEPDDFRKLY